MTPFSQPSTIRLIGCREHNLKNVSLSLPKHAITVITGISGSGKSSLAFDTLFAEGQRRYLEYLSSQARKWIKQMPKPEVDLIEGLSPTLAVGQDKNDLSTRGTVATYTDIYDFLMLLFARIGEQHSPATGKKLVRYSRQEIIDLILEKYPSGNRLQILSPIKFNSGNGPEVMLRLQNTGFVRLRIHDQEWTTDSPPSFLETLSEFDVVVDRLEIKEGIRERLASSVETALDLGKGMMKVLEGKNGPILYLTEIYLCPESGLSFVPLEPSDFNFNSSHGACPVCKGKGGEEKINSSLLFDDLFPFQEQINRLCESFPKKSVRTFEQLIQLFFLRYGIQEETSIKEIDSQTMDRFLFGSKDVFETPAFLNEESKKIKTTWLGLIPFLNRLINEKKIKGSTEDLPFIEWQVCSSCNGAKLKAESLSCFIKGKNIYEWCSLTASDFLSHIVEWEFTNKDLYVANEILPQIKKRLQFLIDVGLGYLELNRPGKTLSTGEAQRIQLASQIGAKLSGIIYILDEPSLGLHPQNMQILQKVIEELKSLGNTIVIVEHERLLINQADHIVEIGPGAGKNGGYILFEGSIKQLIDNPKSLTGQWLTGKKKFPSVPKRKKTANVLQVNHATLHNLHQFSIKIPLNCLVGFCGVSGSGKSTLALDIIGEQIQKSLRGAPSKNLKGTETIKKIVLGEKLAKRFPVRSIPATYVGIMNPLRQLYAETKLAKARGYTASRFSLNKKGGRCEACEGLGQLRINMQLMPDLFIPCDVCNGTRYNYETLQVHFENRSIADVLALSIDDAVQIFKYIPTISPALELMQELGLGYMTLGQPFHTLSGGEIQRMRLVSDLAIKNPEPTLYILDEPSAGLHPEDVAKLVLILHKLVDQGHSVFMIEHHLELLCQSDWLVELGPEGGPRGGKLIFEGTAAQLLKAPTPTGKALKLLNN